MLSEKAGLAVRRGLPAPRSGRAAELESGSPSRVGDRLRDELHNWVVPVVQTCSVDRDLEASEGNSHRH